MTISSDKFSSRTVPATPYRIYLERVKSISESARNNLAQVTHTPLQFGGLDGQQQLTSSKALVTVVDFEVSNS